MKKSNLKKILVVETLGLLVCIGMIFILPNFNSNEEISTGDIGEHYITSLNDNDLTLNTGDTYRLVVNGIDDETKETWTSSDPSVASVDSNGVVTANNEGEAVIWVELRTGSNITTAECVVKVVYYPVTDIKLNCGNSSIIVNYSRVIKATVYPDNATNKELEWISSDEKIATIDNNGKLKAKKEGTVTITAISDDGVEASCELDVIPVPVEKISIDQDNVVLDIEPADGLNSVTLEALIEPMDASNKDIIWTSSNPDVVMVDQTGLVVATGIGEAVITAQSKSDPSIMATCKVEVAHIWNDSNDMNSVSINGTIQYRVALNERDNYLSLDDSRITWQTSDSRIATITDDGLLTGVSDGTVFVEAYYKNSIVAMKIVKVVS